VTGTPENLNGWTYRAPKGREKWQACADCDVRIRRAAAKGLPTPASEPVEIVIERPDKPPLLVCSFHAFRPEEKR
jgi:hypothetical protein